MKKEFIPKNVYSLGGEGAIEPCVDPNNKEFLAKKEKEYNAKVAEDKKAQQ